VKGLARESWGRLGRPSGALEVRRWPSRSKWAPASFLAAFVAGALILAGPAKATEFEVHYAPTERLDRIDVGLIDNAGTSIELAAYVLTDWEVIDALNAAAARGVQVRVVLDPREHSAVDRMVGFDVRRKLPGPLQHLKAYVVDGAVLRTGSANFSHSGETAQDNDLIVVRDPAAVEAFEKNFDRMWRVAQPLASPSAAAMPRWRSALEQLRRRW
jgi:phosphatidylserine/phosphatidylglycerophosphate/cardiolipin synthase-like enzyme